MNEVIENFAPWIGLIESVIANDVSCPSDFEKKFCEGEELIGIYFSSTRMCIVFLDHSGQHITNTYPLQELSDWLESVDEIEEEQLNE